MDSRGLLRFVTRLAFVAALVGFGREPVQAAPIYASGFVVELEGPALFTEVGLPSSPNLDPGDVFDIFIPGLGVVGTALPGDSFDLAPYNSPIFHILAIDSLVDINDPTAFALFLNWSGQATKLTITYIPRRDDPELPEPGLAVLFVIGTAAAIRLRRRSERPKAASGD